MKEASYKRSRKTGLPPGSPVYIGKQKGFKIKISLIDYSASHFEEKEISEIKECFPFKEKDSVTWINVDGVHDPKLMEELSSCYGVHPLVQEDIVNTDQRPKLEDYGDYLYIVVRMFLLNEKEEKISSEQVSFIVGRNYTISFQEEGKEGDVFGTVRERIRSGKTRIRTEGADYLVYSLIDAIVDSYFGIIERLGEKIEQLEEILITKPTQNVLGEIHVLKREILNLRKNVWPLREVIGALERGESQLIRPSTRVYLRDVYDHTVQIIETIENYRDMMSGMLDIYLSSISNRLNEVMKVLTIIATIFIPLTFIVGIYGMNFRNMPELSWEYSYAVVWLVMLSVAAGMLIYFKRKKWL
ncbi:MAG: magnesium/cobalt transporter CorA [Candidatus Saganbacteria bacterium]|nr:magnesium/cobalt transporter CorA [Candidatus Saganbacteria bacterium]